MADHLFTYGTLRLDQSHPMAGYLAGNSELLGLGLLSGAKLYRIDWYPALVESGDDRDQVVGDVFELKSPEALKKIDEYEGIGVGEEGQDLVPVAGEDREVEGLRPRLRGPQLHAVAGAAHLQPGHPGADAVPEGPDEGVEPPDLLLGSRGA